MNLKLEVFVPYLFEKHFSLEHMFGELLFPDDAVVFVQIDDPTAVGLYLLSFDGESGCKLGKRTRGK